MMVVQIGFNAHLITLNGTLRFDLVANVMIKYLHVMCLSSLHELAATHVLELSFSHY